jgi:HEAT repeat protein
VLTQAYEEEVEPELRRAALTSLAACRNPEAIEVFRRASSSSDEGERTIARTALASLAAGDAAHSTPIR